MTTLKEQARIQTLTDAQEISTILRCTLRECRMSQDLRERISAAIDRSDRIARNTQAEL